MRYGWNQNVRTSQWFPNHLPTRTFPSFIDDPSAVGGGDDLAGLAVELALTDPSHILTGESDSHYARRVSLSGQERPVGLIPGLAEDHHINQWGRRRGCRPGLCRVRDECHSQRECCGETCCSTPHGVL